MYPYVQRMFEPRAGVSLVRHCWISKADALTRARTYALDPGPRPEPCFCPPPRPSPPLPVRRASHLVQAYSRTPPPPPLSRTPVCTSTRRLLVELVHLLVLLLLCLTVTTVTFTVIVVPPIFAV